MKTLAIYFSDPEPMGYPFHKKEYLSRYKNIIAYLSRHEITTYIVRGDSYQSKGTFSHGWMFKNKKLLPVESPITADLIWNRDDKNTIPRITDCPIINDPDLDELCVDKFKTFELFPTISPKTSIIHSYQDFITLQKEWGLLHDSLLVVKKNFETEGRGIYIRPVEQITENLYSEWNDILVQEFIDSSIGIPGLTKGMHDLRVTVVNGRPINAFIRTPKEGSYLANVAQGGTGRSVELRHIPDEAIKAVDIIRSELSRFNPSLYAVDLMNSADGFKLVELNSRPGVQHRKWSNTYLRYNHALVEMIVMTLYPTG